MTDPKPATPATDEQVASIKAGLAKAFPAKSASDLAAQMVTMILVARIAADAETIKAARQERDAVKEALVEARETIRKQAEEIERLKGTWRCFHCGFESADKAEAEAHFGDGDGEAAICVDWARLSPDDRLMAYQDSIRELNGERAASLKVCRGLDTLRAQVETLREALASIVHPSPDRPAWWSADQAPGHSHEIPGIWDRDNGEKSGKPCQWCARWLKAKQATEPKG